jgi:hypothetical protein
LVELTYLYWIIYIYIYIFISQFDMVLIAGIGISLFDVGLEQIRISYETLCYYKELGINQMQVDTVDKSN